MAVTWSALVLTMLQKWTWMKCSSDESAIEISDLKEHVLNIVKYSNDTHLPAACHKAAGGRTLVETLQSYLTHLAVLLLVCDNYMEGIDKQIAMKVKYCMRVFGVVKSEQDSDLKRTGSFVSAWHQTCITILPSL